MGFSGKTGIAQWRATSGTPRADGTYLPDPAGDTTNFAEVVGWHLEYAVRLTSYPHSESDGFDDIAIGSKALRGTIEVRLQCALLPVLAGDIVNLSLYNAAIYWDGQAVIESTPIATKIDGGDPVSATYRWRSKGQWTHVSGDADDGNE